MIAQLPDPPYYAVIFSSQRADADKDYNATAERMVELAAQQPGYLGIESARGADGFGITVSYWSSLQAIDAWKNQAEHLVAQRRGKETWYREFALRIARVERSSTRSAQATGGIT
jgi:heme-degrading monooxygenase HmoA